MLPDRFTAKLRIAEDGCWIWQAALRNGYGAFLLSGKMRGAHRVAYELAVGPVPAGLELDHLCRNRACVNPAHLEPVTSAENKRRSPLVRREQGRRGREVAVARALAQTSCSNGHQYTPENTYRRPDGARQCRACQREAAARYRTARMIRVGK